MKDDEQKKENSISSLTMYEWGLIATTIAIIVLVIGVFTNGSLVVAAICCVIIAGFLEMNKNISKSLRRKRKK